MSASHAEQEAARQQDVLATAPSRIQAEDAIEDQKNKQAGQKALRKNARVTAYVDLGHQLQGRQSEAQAQQALLESRFPSDPRPAVTTRVDPELRGTGAGDGQQRRRDAEIRAGHRWDNTRPVTGSAAGYTREEQEQRVKSVSDSQKQRDIEREQRNQYFSR